MGLRSTRQTFIEIQCDQCRAKTTLIAPSAALGTQWLRNGGGWQIGERTGSALCIRHRTRNAETSPLPTTPRSQAMDFIIKNGGSVTIENLTKNVRPTVITQLLTQRYVESDGVKVKIIGSLK